MLTERQIDGHTDMTKLIGAFRHHAKNTTLKLRRPQHVLASAENLISETNCYRTAHRRNEGKSHTVSSIRPTVRIMHNTNTYTSNIHVYQRLGTNI
jgi:hypothetical protein